MASLTKRQYYYYGDGSYCDNGYYYRSTCYGSAWDAWGRWVFLGAAIFVLFMVFLILACLAARRRRAQGRNLAFGGNAPMHNPGYQNNQYAPPPQYNQYGAPNYQYNPGPSGYQTSGVEMQPPAGTYHGTKDGAFAPQQGTYGHTPEVK